IAPPRNANVMAERSRAFTFGMRLIAYICLASTRAHVGSEVTKVWIRATFEAVRRVLPARCRYRPLRLQLHGVRRVVSALCGENAVDRPHQPPLGIRRHVHEGGFVAVLLHCDLILVSSWENEVSRGADTILRLVGEIGRCCSRIGRDADSPVCAACEL